MLIQQKLLQIFFTAGFIFSFLFCAKATNQNIKGFQASPAISIDEQDKKSGDIKFQINSDITYFNVDNFKKADSKQAFLDALNKEKLSGRITSQMDSLRSIYTEASDDQKEKIAAKILEGEQKTLALNDDIPLLYEKARALENEYWLTASTEEKSNFINKIKAYRDSLAQVELLIEKNNSISKTVPDTIVYYRADKINEIAAETPQVVVYKIQVASYKTKLPDTVAKAIKKLELLRKVDSYKDEKGMNIFTTGSLKSYQEALTLQTQVKLEGIKNATIAAFSNGKRITIEDAKKLSNETNVKP
ncbi:MAG TPA: hypothetical protein PLG33_07095 [Prolixibacteraceae bacterium]|nr:hypothetical protein [Prolixibacteraceae bacterium]